MSKELIVYPTRGHLLKIDDKYYKLDKEEMDEEKRTVIKQTFIEITPDAYTVEIKEMAEIIAKRSDVRLSDIVEDALKDLPLERVMELKNSLDEIPVPIRTGGCVELKIGKSFLILRE